MGSVGLRRAASGGHANRVRCQRSHHGADTGCTRSGHDCERFKSVSQSHGCRSTHRLCAPLRLHRAARPSLMGPLTAVAHCSGDDRLCRDRMQQICEMDSNAMQTYSHRCPCASKSCSATSSASKPLMPRCGAADRPGPCALPQRMRGSLTVGLFVCRYQRLLKRLQAYVMSAWPLCAPAAGAVRSEPPRPK